MPQNDRNSRNRKRRRAYDQARDDRRGGQSTQRRSSAGAGSDLGSCWGSVPPQDINWGLRPWCWWVL